MSNEFNYAIYILKKEYLRLSMAFVPDDYKNNIELLKKHKKEIDRTIKTLNKNNDSIFISKRT